MLTVKTTVYKNSPKILWIETKPAEIQIQVASKLGIHLGDNDSFLTASAKIEDAVAEAIGDTRILEPTDKQKEIATKIGVDISHDSRRVAWAKIRQKIQWLNYEANSAAIKSLGLRVGDTAIERRTFTMPNGQTLESETQGVVTFIKWDGAVTLRDTNKHVITTWAQRLKKPKPE
jgi:hypothetical protein